jgi:glycosyltransferase involved in cell wall biosynthesis
MPEIASSAERSLWDLTLVLDGFNPRARDSREPRALAAALAARGHRCEVLLAHGGVWAKQPIDGGGSACILPQSLESVLSGEPVGATSGHRRALLAYDGSSPAAWVAARAAARRGLPLLVVEPGWNDLKRLRERVLETFGRHLWGRVVRQCTQAVLAFDPLARDQALERGFPASLVELCAGGVDRSLFRPGMPTRLISRHRLVGRLLISVGPFEPGRGLELLVRAFAASVGQREDWTLLLVGAGSLRGRLVTLATRLGIAGRVRLLDYPPPEELAGLLGAGTLFALPAEDERARGVQLARALACGLPVLVADLPRYRFRFTPGLEGLVVPPGDQAAWSGTLARLAQAPELRQQMAAAARAAGSGLGWERAALAVEAGLQRAALTHQPGARAG